MFQIQRIALDVVRRVLSGRNLTDTLGEALAAAPDLSPPQRGAIRDLCYGTLRYHNQLAALVELMVARAPSEPLVPVLLEVTLYQLQHTRAAPYAVVDHAVRLTQRIAPHHKGLVNAVLRRFLRERGNLMQRIANQPALHYCLPEWWLKRLQADFPETWQQVAEACLQHPPMALRANRRHTNAADYLTRLADAGLEASASSEYSLQLAQPVPVERLPGFFDGWVSVQDIGAQKAADWLDLADGQRVLDACAAPGGKTGHILEVADVELLALDHDAQRLQRVTDNLNRLKLKAEVKAGDAARPVAWWDNRPFDRILLDAPCSASGVIRRNPDIKWHRRPEDLAGFARQQAAMLKALWPLLQPGGKLLYATCSIFPEENRSQVERFLAETPDARLEPLDGQPMQQLLPTSHHDGFFYARLAKQA